MSFFRFKKMLSLITRQLWSVVTYEVLVFLENISVLESYFWNFNELFLGHRQWSFQRPKSIIRLFEGIFFL